MIMDLKGKGHAKLFGRLGKTGTDTFHMMKSSLKGDFLDNHIVSEGQLHNSQRHETVEYGHKLRGTWNQE
jgi:hypothetical protein